MKLYMKNSIVALVAGIGIVGSLQATSPGEKAFLYIMKHGDTQETKALALAIAKAGYQRALDIMKPELNHVGLGKLEQTIQTIDQATGGYEYDTRFQLALAYALSSFKKLPFRFRKALVDLQNKGISEGEGRKSILKNELYTLNQPYQYVVRAMKKKKIAWPQELKKINYETLLRNWSSFMWQAQSF